MCLVLLKRHPEASVVFLGIQLLRLMHACRQHTLMHAESIVKEKMSSDRVFHHHRGQLLQHRTHCCPPRCSNWRNAPATFPGRTFAYSGSTCFRRPYYLPLPLIHACRRKSETGQTVALRSALADDGLSRIVSSSRIHTDPASPGFVAGDMGTPREPPVPPLPHSIRRVRGEAAQAQAAGTVLTPPPLPPSMRDTPPLLSP